MASDRQNILAARSLLKSIPSGARLCPERFDIGVNEEAPTFRRPPSALQELKRLLRYP
jgi:hypothetical protein